jgi:hypothetical protein
MREQRICLTSGALVKESSADGLRLSKRARAPGVQSMPWLAIRSLAKRIVTRRRPLPGALIVGVRNGGPSTNE